MTNELSAEQFKATFTERMVDFTDIEIDNPVNIWGYVKELVESGIVLKSVFEKELVEKVYRNDINTYDQVLLPTNDENTFVVIVVDIQKESILGHHVLDLNIEFGLK
ncbi:MAG: hypothetical protein M0D57_00345 [Sphingobacteriales bacterium JAD_PAG50586_3]|nr:MAG: hypothetical protein M0D57_00345 [Sphingobacteriales bacterium JAD_PAG50586_3]